MARTLGNAFFRLAGAPVVGVALVGMAVTVTASGCSSSTPVGNKQWDQVQGSGDSSGGDDSSGGGASSNGASSNGASGSGASSNGGGAPLIGNGNGGAGGEGVTNKCAGEAHANEAEPVDMYIMFDQSSSMNDPVDPNAGPTTWWQTAQAAVTAFVTDQRANGMGVGLQYFPLNGVAPASCDAPYSTPEVPIGLLPGNASALSSSIQKHNANAFTPTRAALSGAVTYMTAYAQDHPGRAPAVVLVTDGFPTECSLGDPTSGNVQDVVNVAKDAFTKNKIRTFVIGFDHGAGLDNLSQVATAGGTGDAFVISNGDIGSQFVDAMLNIAGSPVQCEFPIPAPADPNQSINFDEILVQYVPNATKTPEEVPKVGAANNCDLAPNQKGWYYDDINNPKHIEVCPGTCNGFGAGVVKTVIGCKPVVILKG